MRGGSARVGRVVEKLDVAGVGKRIVMDACSKRWFYQPGATEDSSTRSARMLKERSVILRFPENQTTRDFSK